MNHFTATTTNWRTLNSQSPIDERSTTIAEKSENVFRSPARIMADSASNTRTFRNFDAYKQELNPSGSKVGFQDFLTKITTDKKIYDSNIAANLDVQRKIVAHRSKEQHVRAATLSVNKD
jgi:hypothetical protein